jgi:hypothetical protein
VVAEPHQDPDVDTSAIGEALRVRDARIAALMKRVVDLESSPAERMARRYDVLARRRPATDAEISRAVPVLVELLGPGPVRAMDSHPVEPPAGEPVVEPGEVLAHAAEEWRAAGVFPRHWTARLPAAAKVALALLVIAAITAVVHVLW